MIAYWAGYELGNPLASLADQPFGIVIISMGHFYSETYSSAIYDACGWSLNVAVKECPLNTTTTSTVAGLGQGYDCGAKGWVEPPPGCCRKDPTKANSQQCPGKPNCNIQCSQGCEYAPEPAGCCFSPSGIDARYLTLRHTLTEIRDGIKVLQAAGKRVMISMFDRMRYQRMAASVTLADVNPAAAAQRLAHFVHDLGLDGVDFNFEFIDCPGAASASSCHWTDIVQQTRTLLPDKLLSMTVYAGSGNGVLGVLNAVKDAERRSIFDNRSANAES